MFLQILSAESEPKKKLKHIFMAATRYRDFYNLVSFFFFPLCSSPYQVEIDHALRDLHFSMFCV